MNNKLFEKFCEYGSGFKLEAERDYKDDKLYLHLTMYGLVYPDDYELVGTDLEKLIRQAMKDGDKGFEKLK